MNKRMGRLRAVFFDRDGVLNELVQRGGGGRSSPRLVSDFRIVESAPVAVRRLREHGFLVFVVTNQPDIARGKLRLQELLDMHRLIAASLRPDEIACCPHDERTGCACRKPKPGMIVDLANRWGVDLATSFVVGDTWKDVAAGRAAGCRTILLGDSHDAHEVVADWVVSTLDEAVQVMERECGAVGRSNGLCP